MADESKTPANPEPQTQVEPEIDWKVKYEALEKQVAAETQQRTNLDAQYKNLQRELNKARARGEPTGALREELNELRGVIGELTGIVAEKLGDETTAQSVRSKLSQSEARSQAKAVAQQTAETLAEIAEAAGFDDFDTFWNTPEMSRARAAWNAGDANSTVREATKVALVKKQAVAPTAPTLPPAEPAKPAATPAKKLDTGPASAGGPARSAAELAAVETSGMSAKELQAHEQAIYTALEREMGVKFKR